MNILEKLSPVRRFYQQIVGGESLAPADNAFARMRADAINQLDSLEFPTTKSENWKYVRTASLLKKEWRKSSVAPVPSDLAQLTHVCSIVFINGRFSAENSIIPKSIGVEIMPAQAADWSDWNAAADYYPNGVNPFHILSQAVSEEGVAIKVAKNTVSVGEIGVYYFATGNQELSATSNCIVAGSGAKVKLSMFHIGANQSWQMHNTLFVVGTNAELAVEILQKGDSESYSMSHSNAVVSDDARFTMNTATIGGKFIRNEVNVLIDGQGSEANLNGFYMPAQGELVDNHTVVDHAKAHSQSNETYRGILSGNGVGVFNGKVFVRQDAQKTNAFQSNSNVLLSDEATMNSKPELEIYADDVKCSHGSTTGQLDSDAIFYLRTRGLSEASARKVLVEAFAESVISEFSDLSIIGQIQATVQRKLAL